MTAHVVIELIGGPFDGETHKQELTIEKPFTPGVIWRKVVQAGVETLTAYVPDLSRPLTDAAPESVSPVTAAAITRRHRYVVSRTQVRK